MRPSVEPIDLPRDGRTTLSASVVATCRCLPGRPDVRMCRAEEGRGRLAAGAAAAAALRIVLRDSCGNHTAVSQVPCEASEPGQGGDGEGFALAVTCDGPGPMVAMVEAAAATETETETMSAAAMTVKCAATVAGKYLLTVVDSCSRIAVPGSPFAVTVTSAHVCAARCTATLKQSESKLLCWLPDDIRTATAEVRLSLLDEFGNPVDADHHENYGHKPTIKAWAHGPVAVELTHCEVGCAGLSTEFGGRDSSKFLFLAYLPLAGDYTVSMSIDGTTLGGLSRLVRVLPRAALAARCRVLPECTATSVNGGGEHAAAAAAVTATVGVAHAVTLRTADVHGNACVSGGAKVSATAVRVSSTTGSETDEEQTTTIDVAVTDHGDGSYALVATPPMAGEWHLHVVVNGRRVPRVPYEGEALTALTAYEAEETTAAAAAAGTLSFEAVWGALRAVDCTLRGAPDGTSVACGERLQLRLTLHGGRRRLAPTDAATLTMTSPSGVVRPLPPASRGVEGSGRPVEEEEEEEAAVVWTVACTEPGSHVLSAMLNGHHVMSSPLTLQAAPATLCLAASVIRAEGDGVGAAGRFSSTATYTAVAGRRTWLRIALRDSAGQPLALSVEAAAVAVRIEAACGTVQNARSTGGVGGVVEWGVAAAAAGGGEISVWYTVEAAGPFELRLVASATEEVCTLHGRCVAGASSLARCALLPGATARLAAGMKGVARVALADAVGNPVTAHGKDDVTLMAHGVGPGEMTTEVLTRPNGVLEVRTRCVCFSVSVCHNHDAYRKGHGFFSG
jgi:hypothetical protein